MSKSLNKIIYNYTKPFVVLVLIFVCVQAISSGANEPIADNELGLTAKDCAKQYCEQKDGLGLWLTLVNECVDSPNPYFVEKINKINNIDTNSIFEEGVKPIVVGGISAILGIVGLILGYTLGTTHGLHSFKYKKISTIEM